MPREAISGERLFEELITCWKFVCVTAA